jgi:hypothetical protein
MVETMLQAGRPRVPSPDEVTDIFQFTQSFQPHHDPGVYLTSNINEFQKIFLGVKRHL